MRKAIDLKVSIIIPVYNVSAYIERCVKSVINQTYNNIECIIVDDATSDDSILKCERLISAESNQKPVPLIGSPFGGTRKVSCQFLRLAR